MEYADNIQYRFHGKDPNSDKELWEEIKKGNQSALSFVYKKYVKALYRYGYFLVHDKDMVEDAIHDVFINIWNARNNQINIHHLKSYLYTSVRREVLNKKKNVSKPSFQLEDIEDQIVGQPSTEEIWINSEYEKENVEKIRSFINNLSDRQREIIFLRYYQNMSYQDIADLLKLDQNYTYNLMSKAFNQLRKQFSTNTRRK